MKTRLSFFLVLILISNALTAQDAGLFPFSPTGERLTERWAPQDARFVPAGATGNLRVEGDQFLDEQNLPHRLWGVNMTFQANFPPKDAAPRLAKRIAIFGINCVRLHFVDTVVWGKNEAEFGHTRFDPEMLDRLDWFIFQLKQNGVYVNLNLHVGRMLDERDGPFPDASRLPWANKGVDNFDPDMIRLQKQYAHDLLTHVNPYTQTQYTTEPCVASVEINNENSVVSSWQGGAIDALPPHYAEILRTRWNDWLAARYPSTDALRQAWKLPAPTPEIEWTSEAHWKLETREDGIQKCEQISENSFRIEVEKQGADTWNPQFYFCGAAARKNVPFKVSFRLHGSSTPWVCVNSVQNHNPWQELELKKWIQVPTEARAYEFEFLPSADDPDVRIGISRLNPGTYWVEDFRITRGGEFGLRSGDALENRTVPVLSPYAVSTSEQRADFLTFLFALEEQYWTEMYAYLKNELRVRAPVAGTQLGYGTIRAQQKLDYCDNHRYWNHPEFPNRGWDQNDWCVANRAMVNHYGKLDTLLGLAWLRVLGKPYVISEYNHPYPNLYAAEGFPMIASFGAFQGWSGIYNYTWAHNESHVNQMSFFDLCESPALLVHYPACRNMFVRGDVSPDETGLSEENTRDLTAAREQEIYIQNQPGISAIHIEMGLEGETAWNSRVGLNFQDSNNETKIGIRNQTSCVRNPEKQLIWNHDRENRGYCLVDTARTKVFTGFVDGRTFRFSDGTEFAPGPSILDWMTVSLTQTAENRYLLAANGLVKNQNSILRPYDGEAPKDLRELLGRKITTNGAPGTTPQICEGIAAVIRVPVPSDVLEVVFYPLDASANRVSRHAARRVSDTLVEIVLSPEYKTLWYEIEFCR